MKKKKKTRKPQSAGMPSMFTGNLKEALLSCRHKEVTAMAAGVCFMDGCAYCKIKA